MGQNPGSESKFNVVGSTTLSFTAVFSLQDNSCEHCEEKFPKLEMLEVGIFVGMLQISGYQTPSTIPNIRPDNRRSYLLIIKGLL